MSDIKKYIGTGLTGLSNPESPNLNVINILRTLVEDDNCVCYIPLNYSAERKTTKDPRVHFNPIEAGKTIAVTGIQSNQERFNFSLTGEVDVLVEFESLDGSVELLPKKIFRTYTIVRDGKLTIDYIIAKLSKDAFDELRNAGVLYYNGIEVAKNHAYAEGFLYKIILNTIPVISLAWAQPLQIGLYDNLVKENVLSNTLTKVNKIIKDFKASGVDVVEDSSDSIYYIEAWNGEEKITSGELVDCFVYEVKDNKDVDVELISKAELSLSDAIITKKNINKQLKAIRFINRCVVCAIESSKNKGTYNWSDMELVPRSKEKYRQFCTITTIDNSYELQRTTFKKVI